MNVAFLEEKRNAAQERFKTLGIPTRRSEAWRHIDLEPFLGTTFKEPAESAEPSIEACAIAPYLFPESEEVRLVFLNGRYSRKWSTEGDLPPGAVVTDLGGVRGVVDSKLAERYLASAAGAESNAFAALNTLHFRDGAFLFVPEGTVLEKRIHFLFVTTEVSGEPMVYYPRVLMALARGAKASVVISHAGHSQKTYFVDAVVEANLAEEACLDCVFLRRADAQTGYLFTSELFKLEKNSTLRVHRYTQGGLLTRSETDTELLGEGVSADLSGLSVLEGQSKSHNHLTVHHKAGHCVSRQFYKNILTGTSKAEFDSLVRVAKGAMKSDSRQLNRNLILSQGAEGHSRPRLEIQADDVSCTHGATTGPMEETELFYLRSRGLSLDMAKELLVYGFAEDVLASIQDVSVRERLESFVRAALVGGTPLLKASS